MVYLKNLYKNILLKNNFFNKMSLDGSNSKEI